MGGISGIFLTVLNAIYSFVGNYGWSIVLFTLLVRFVLLPLDIKQKKNMRAMAKLQPKQAELQRKYGKDKDKLNQKMQELYKREKVSPLSGCLPLLIQLPLLWLMFSAMRSLASEQIAKMLLQIVDSMPALADGTTVRDGLAAIQINLSGLNLAADQIKAIVDGVTSLTGAQRDAVEALGLITLSSDQIAAIMAKLNPEQVQLISQQVQSFLGTITLTPEQAQTLSSNIPFQSWLWIKNVFEPDSFMSAILPSAKAVTMSNADILKGMQLSAMSGSSVLTADNLGIVASFLKTPAYASIAQALGANDFTRIPLNLLFFTPTITLPTSFAAFFNSANGLFILPLFAAVSQFFMTKLTTGKTPETPVPANSQQAQSNPMNSGLMKWFFPLFSLWICAGYNAAFAIYWGAVNVIQIVQTYVINLYYDRKDRQAALVQGQDGSDSTGA